MLKLMLPLKLTVDTTVDMVDIAEDMVDMAVDMVDTAVEDTADLLNLTLRLKPLPNPKLKPRLLPILKLKLITDMVDTVVDMADMADIAEDMDMVVMAVEDTADL